MRASLPERAVADPRRVAGPRDRPRRSLLDPASAVAPDQALRADPRWHRHPPSTTSATSSAHCRAGRRSASGTPLTSACRRTPPSRRHVDRRWSWRWRSSAASGRSAAGAGCLPLAAAGAMLIWAVSERPSRPMSAPRPCHRLAPDPRAGRSAADRTGCAQVAPGIVGDRADPGAGSPGSGRQRPTSKPCASARSARRTTSTSSVRCARLSTANPPSSSATTTTSSSSWRESRSEHRPSTEKNCCRRGLRRGGKPDRRSTSTPSTPRP